MAKQTSRGARLTALALATGTLVVAATSSAGAAPVTVPDIFGGKAEGHAIVVKINLPVAVNVPGVGDITSIEQTISSVNGNLAKSTTSVASEAVAVLGEGDIPVVSDLLALKTVARLDGQHNVSDALAEEVNLGLIKASVGQINSSVSPESASSTLTSTSKSSLLNLSVGLGGLADSLPIKTELDSVADTLEGALAADGELGSALNGALGQIETALDDAGATPVAEQIEAVKTVVVNLLDQLSQTVGNLTSSTNLVELSLLESKETVTRVGDAVTARAETVVGGLNVLGGLVTVDTAKTVSESRANGVKGAAAADSSTTITHVKVADVLELILGEDGLTGSLLGQEIPTAVKDAFDTVLDTVNTVLDVAGVQIVNGDVVSDVDPNGKYASSSSKGIGIVVNPLRAAEPLLSVQLVPAGTAVNAARITRVPTVTQPRPAPKTPLARTGAELPLFAVIGTGLAGLALVVRRRRVDEV